MPEQPNIGLARALRQYMPKLQPYDDATVTRFVREIYSSGDPQRIGRFVSDVRRYVPRYAKLDDRSTADELGRMFGVQPVMQRSATGQQIAGAAEPYVTPVAPPQPALAPQDYLGSLYATMFAGGKPNVADMATVMNQVTAPGIPQHDLASVTMTPVLSPEEIAKGLRGAQRVEQMREAGARAGVDTPKPIDPRKTQELEFGHGINRGVNLRTQVGAEGTATAGPPLQALYNQMAQPPAQPGAMPMTTPGAGIPNPAAMLAGGETISPPAPDLARGINRTLPLQGPGYELDAWGDRPSVYREWPETAPASMVTEDISRTFAGKPPVEILKNIRAYVGTTLPDLEAQLAGLPPEQFVMDPLVPNPVPVGDEFSARRRALTDAIARLRTIEKTPKNIRPQNALKGILDALVDVPTDVAPFLGDVHGMVKEAEVALIAEKIAKNTVTPEEKALYDAYQLQKNFAQSSETDYFYEGGRMIPRMASYGGAFAALKGLRKYGEKVFTRSLLRAFGGGQTTRQAARMTAPMVGGALAGAADVPGIARGMMERMQDSYEIGVSPAGEILYRQLEKEGDPALNAAFKALASNMAEYGTEQFGEALVAIKRSFVGRMMRRKGLAPTDVQKAMQSVKEGIGWQGTGYEIAEEEVNEPIQAWIDGREYDDPLTTVKGQERLLTEIIGIGMFGAPFSLVNAREKRIQRMTEDVRKQRMGERTDTVLDEMEGAVAPPVAQSLQTLYDAMAGGEGLAIDPDLRARMATGRMQERMGQTRMDTRKPAPARQIVKAEAEQMVNSGFARSVSLIGSQASGKARPDSDMDMLIDLGNRALPADPTEASAALEEIVSSEGTGVDVGARDYFFKVGDRYFHLASGAGMGIVENTEYGQEQAGKPTQILAGAMQPEAAPAAPTGEADRADYAQYLTEQGITAEEAQRDSEREDDLRPQPEAELQRVRLGPSKIEGQGVFGTTAFAKGTPIATAITQGGRTDLVGRNINHAADANTTHERQPDGSIMIVAKRDIAPGEELTMDYRLPEIFGQAATTTPTTAAPSTSAAGTPDLAQERTDIIRRLRTGELDPIDAVRQYGERHPKLTNWQAYRQANKPIGTLKYHGQQADVVRTADGVELVSKKGARLGTMTMAEYQKQLGVREQRSAQASERNKNLVLIPPAALPNMPAVSAIFGRKVGDQTGDMLDDVRVGINQVRSRPLVDKKSPDVDYDTLHEFLAESDNPQHQAWAAQGLGFTEIYQKALDEITQYQGGKITAQPKAEAGNPMARLDTYLDSLKPDEFVNAWQALSDEQKKSYKGEEYEDLTPDEIAQMDRVYLNGEWYKVRTEGGKTGDVILEDGTTITFDRVFDQKKHIPIEKVEKGGGTAPASQTPAQKRAVEDTGAAAARPFDAKVWDKERSDRIKASKAAGNTHLDQVPPYVETMRGKSVYYVHDPEVRGKIRTVDNRGNVYIDWSDAYSAEKENASPVQEGNKTFMRTSLGPTDLKDYVLSEGTRAPAVAEGNLPQGDMFGAPAGKKKLSAEDEYGLKNPAQLAGRERAEKKRQAEERKAAAEQRIGELKAEVAQYRRELRAAPEKDKARVRAEIERAQKALARAMAQVGAGETMFDEGTTDVFGQPEAPEQATAQAPLAAAPAKKRIADMTFEEMLDGSRFYRSGKNKNLQLPDGERVILMDTSTPTNWKQDSREFLTRLYRRKGGKSLDAPERATPKDGWRDNLIKAREYALNLGMNLSGTKPGEPSRGYTVSRDTWTNLNLLVDAIDGYLAQKAAPATEPAAAAKAPASPRDQVKDALWKNRMHDVFTDLPNGDQVRVALFNGEAELIRITPEGKRTVTAYDDANRAIDAAMRLYDEEKPEPAGTIAPAAAPSATDKARAELEELKRKFLQQTGNTLTAGVDPAAMATAAQIAIKYAEIGVLKFGEFAKEAIDLVGEAIKPYLKGAYLMAKQQQPRDVRRTMDSEDDVEDFDLEGLSSAPVETEPPPAETPAPVPEPPAPKTETKAPPREKNPAADDTKPGAPTEYEKGDRVVITESYSDEYTGRHGEITGVDAYVMQSGFLGGARVTERHVSYTVRTDGGAQSTFPAEYLEIETGEAPEAVPDVKAPDRVPMVPGYALRSIASDYRRAENAESAAGRARKPEKIREYRRTAELARRDAEELSAVMREWMEANPEAAAQLDPEEVRGARLRSTAAPTPAMQTGQQATPLTSDLDAEAIVRNAGLVVHATQTKNGKPVWEVSGNTRAHLDTMKALRGRWYGPKKVWSFYNEDPTEAIARAIAPESAQAPTAPAATPSAPTPSAPAPATATTATATAEGVLDIAAYERLATDVEAQLHKGTPIAPRDLIVMANKAFGGTMGEGTYSAADMYDALEFGVNRWILNTDISHGKNTVMTKIDVEKIRDMLRLLPTQRIRTEEKDEMQQFSTVPQIAYLVNWLANVSADDVVLEPSAGNGGIAAFAKNAGATVVANELSPRRAALLRALGIGEVFEEDAEQLDNLLPDRVQPTVVEMNPPYSSTQRMPGQRMTANATIHLEQALRRLQPGGRLVTVVGEGMTLSQDTTDPSGRRPTGAQLAPWWKDLMKRYNVRANFGIAGKEYAKYGTGWPLRIIVIDKTGPTTAPVMQGFFETVEDAIKNALVQEVRNGRPEATRTTQQPAGESGRGQSTASARPEARPEPVAPGPTDTMGALGERPAPERGPTRGPADRGAAAGPARSGGGLTLVSGERSRPRTPQERRATGSSAASAGSVLDGNDPRFRVTPENRMAYTADPAREDRREVNAESAYETYTPQRIDIPGAKPHPGNLVESAAMASVEPPMPTYVPMFSREFVESGTLSNVQLESVIYAGQAHEQQLADGTRRGFFIGDGTGVGKGREIAGIILDNWNQGRRRHIWITKNQALYDDAVRDIKAVFGDAAEKLIHNLSDYKIDKDIPVQEGIVFVTYNTMIGRSRRAERTRIEQLREWASKDFDGVIAFDEAHKMGSALDMKGKRGMKKASQTALAGLSVVDWLPDSRVVYASATGATEVDNLGYLDRLGLWGKGTAFSNKRDFIASITAGGIASMELAARDMKALGLYLSRSLSYEGISYDIHTHALREDQKAMYGTLVDAWRLVFDNFNRALEHTAGFTTASGEVKVDGMLKGRAMSAFWGANQRFWSQIITSMKAPTMIADIERQIAAGEVAVIQLVNTFEAQQSRKLADLEDEEDLEMLDMTPREGLMQLVEHSFPVNSYQQEEDENGNVKMVPVLDRNGDPVQDKEAVRMRDALLDRLADVRVPDSPLDLIINTFGPENVAEITGRRRRVVRTVDRDGKQTTVIESRSKAKRDAELARFRDDKIRILVFSDAGGTGASYHADRGTKNQRQRNHHMFQPGWIANNAMQGLGRTHRTNQASAPSYYLVTTDLPGEKRFISSIAKRLQQLGALTRGQRDASSGGLFSERDNLEGEIARDALQQLYKDVFAGSVSGLGTQQFEDMTGLSIVDQDNNLKENLPAITQFLNRMLNMPIDVQNSVFEALSSRIDAQIETARRMGTLDVGMETVRAKSIRIAEEQTVFTDERSQAQTKYVRLEVTRDAIARRWEDGANRATGWAVNRRSGRIYAVSDAPPITDKYGRVIERYFLDGITKGKFIPRNEFTDERYQRIADPKEAKPVWQAEYETTPKVKTEDMHLITGALLPVWDRIDKEQSRINRVITEDGRMILGRVIPEAKLTETLNRLGAEASGITFDPADVVAKILDSNYSATFTNKWRIQRAIVDGEERIEFTSHTLQYGDSQRLTEVGAIAERRDYRMRVFLPAGAAGARVLEKLAKDGKSIVQLDAPDNGEDELDAIAATVHRAKRPNTKNTPPPTGAGGAGGAGKGPGSPAPPAAGAAAPGPGAGGNPPSGPGAGGPGFRNAPGTTKVVQPATFTLQPPENAEARAIAGRIAKDPKGKKVGMRTISDWLASVVHAETRIGKEQTNRRHPAHFETGAGLIRTQTGHSATYNMHEIGHAISAFLRDRNPQAFRGLGQALKDFAIAAPYASAESAEEGIAEWVRLFVTDYEQIAGTPLTLALEAAITREASVILSALRDANRLHYAHVARGVRAVRASINVDKGIPPAIMDRVHSGVDALLFRAVASRHAIEHVRRVLWRGWKHTVPVPRLTGKRWLENLRSVQEYLRNRKAAVDRAREWEKKMQDSPADMKSAYATVLRLPQEIDYFLRGTGKAHRGQRIIATGGDGVLTTATADALEKAGYYVPPQMRAISSKRRRYGAQHGQYVFFDNSTIGDIVQEVGNENWDEFQEYAWDRTDLFRAEKLGLDYAGLSDGITKADLRKSVREYEAAHPDWRGRYDELNRYMDNLAVIAVAGGLIEVDQAIAMKEKHEQYIPLLKEREREMAGYGSSSGVYISAQYHRATGSELPKIPLLNAIEIRTRQVLSAYYYNRMAMAPVRYAEMIRGDNTIPYDVRKQAERVAVHLSLDRVKMATLGEDEAAKVIAEYLNQQLLKQMQAQDPSLTELPMGAEIRAKDVEIHWSGMGIFRATDPRAVHVIAPMVQGERVFYQIEDPILYEFFSRTNNPKSIISRMVQQWVLPVVSPWKRQITQTLKFVVGNIPRDITTALFTGRDLASLVPGYYHITGMIYKMTGQVPDSVTGGQLLSRAYETAFDPAQLVRMNQFQQVLSEGLLVPGWGVMTRGERLRAIAMDAPGKLVNLLVKPAEMLLWATGQRKLAELSEESARLGGYYAAKKRGLSDEAAQMEYDIITGLFADHPGNPDLETFVRLPGFLNPTNQIMYEWIMRLTDPDTKERQWHWFKIAYIGALTAVGWALNMLLMGDDEYGKLKERPDEERFHFMPIGGVLKVPFDNGPLGATQMFTWNMMDAVAGGDKGSADKIARNFLRKMIAFPTSPVEFMQPQLVTMLEIIANYKFYWQQQIVPQWMTALPPEAQYFPTTPEVYRAGGERLGISPLKLQHAVRSGMSPVADDVIRFYDAMTGGVPIRSFDQIPGFSTRLQHEPMGFYSRSVEEVSDKAEQFQQTVSALKKKYGMEQNMQLFDAADELYRMMEDLDARDRTRFEEVIPYADHYQIFKLDDDAVEKLYEEAKEARKYAIETRAPEDWAVVDELLRAMVTKAQQITVQR